MLPLLGKATQLRYPESPESRADSVDIQSGERLPARAVADERMARPFHRQRRMSVALFCDLRGFTSFVDGAEPKDVLTLLDEACLQGNGNRAMVSQVHSPTGLRRSS
jgi:class 3 adenylate cyclase